MHIGSIVKLPNSKRKGVVIEETRGLIQSLDLSVTKIKSEAPRLTVGTITRYKLNIGNFIVEISPYWDVFDSGVVEADGSYTFSRGKWWCIPTLPDLQMATYRAETYTYYDMYPPLITDVIPPNKPDPLMFYLTTNCIGAHHELVGDLVIN